MPNPNTIPYLHYQDIQIPDFTLKREFYDYFRTGQYAEALSVLNTNEEQLRGKAFVANTINIIINGLLNLEDRYYSGVTVFLSDLALKYQQLINNLRRRGDWVDSVQYVPYNFVIYNDTIYMCFSQPPVGTLPTNTQYWLEFDLRGPKGPPGVDVNMKYEWNRDTTYYPNDLVTYQNNIYVALVENNRVLPGSNPDTWLLFIKIEIGQLFVGSLPPEYLTNDTIWFHTSSDPDQATTTNPIPGRFKRYVEDRNMWDDMYPNTIFNWVVNYSNYIHPIFVLNKTIQTSEWSNNQWSYTYENLTENTLVDILPNGITNTNQISLYNSLSLNITGNVITLIAGTTPNVSLPIQIRITQ